MQIQFEKKLAAGFSILSNSVIICLKFFAGILSGSISIISEAIHSLSDFFASILTFFAVTRSAEPADKEHPFGHGKYEDMSGFIEGVLIILAAFYIIYESFRKMFCGHAIDITSMLGVWVMGFSVVANFFVSKYLFHVAKKSDSISLFADAEHLRTDIYSSLGVLLGLILIKFTGWVILDSLVAIIVAFLILKTGFSISKNTLNNLLDGALPSEDIEKVENILCNYDEILGFKDIKTRRVGPSKNLELTVIFDDSMTIKTCHTICDDIENQICEVLGNTVIIIHPEPKCSLCGN